MGHNTGEVRSIDHYQAGRKAAHFLDALILLMSVHRVVTSLHNNSRLLLPAHAYDLPLFTISFCYISG